MSNTFYDNLDKNTKQIFDALKYKPTSEDDANNFITKHFRLDDLKDIFITPKEPINFNGKQLKFVKITAKKPLMACIPTVWQNMKTYQKLKTIIMLYNYYCNQMIGDATNRPKLKFCTKYCLGENILASCFFNENYIYMPLHKIFSASDCVALTATLTHEIQHFKQMYQKQEIYEWLKQNDYDFSKLTKYEKHLFFQFTGHIEAMIYNLYQIRSEKLFQQMIATSNLTRENIDLWLRLEAQNDYNWLLLKQLAYDFNDQEISSQNVEMKKLKDLHNFFVKPFTNSDIDTTTKRESDLKLLQKAGFDIDIVGAQHIANVGNLANMVDEDSDLVYYDALNYLLEIYKAKKVDKPFVDNYDEIESAYFERQQKALLKQRDKKLENEQGSETNELWFF